MRDKGAQHGCIYAIDSDTDITADDENKAVQLAKEFAGLTGLDLAKECCHPQGFEWTQGTWELADNPATTAKYGKTDSPTGGYFKQLGKHISKNFMWLPMILAQNQHSTHAGG